MKHQHRWTTVSLNAMTPKGWIRLFLEHQRDGLTGHLEAAGYPFNTVGWLSDNLPLGDRGGTGWWPYEQIAYWIDGMMRCGILLGDKKLQTKARKQIDHVMNRPDRDGYLGPDAMKTIHQPGGSERWPHAVFFRAVIADYEKQPRTAYLQKLIRHYLSATADHNTNRNVCNVEIMAWLYELTGDERMLELAVRSYRQFQKNEKQDGATLKNMKSNRRIGDHGPRHMELFKLGAIMYRLTGKSSYLKAAMNARRKLIRDHVLLDGVPSSTEHLRGVYSTAGHETCVITDYLWSLGHLLQATGDAGIADEMEKICFNALPGAVTPDFKALQYFSGPNQVEAGPQTNHHPHGIGSTHISFRPNPGTECCPGNVHRAMPAFAGRMWMNDDKGGVVAALYGPSTVVVGKGSTRMVIKEETNYPFEDRITFRFSMSKPKTVPFTFRIPGWCRRPKLYVNGKPSSQKLTRGTYHTMRRTFRDGDIVEIDLPKSLRICSGPEEGIGVLYGPLVMALRIGEKKSNVEDNRSTASFPSWTIEPSTDWNMGLVLDRRSLAKGWALHTKPIKGNPWDPECTPLCITARARKITGWKLIRHKKLVLNHGNRKRVIEGDLRFMPELPKKAVREKAIKKEDIVELLPYGATCLRISWFPVLPV